MSDKSLIEWTDATWNPITGCSVVSPGCKHCYAMKLAGGRLRHHPTRAGLTVDSKAGPVWTGAVRFNEAMLLDPLRWGRSRRIFVCAHGDLFAEGVPDEWIDQVFAVMALCAGPIASSPSHQFQVLTKRPERMRAYLSDPKVAARIASDALAEVTMEYTGKTPLVFTATWPLPNVWLGVSAEDQQRADERIPPLLAMPATKRFVSLEPLLGPIDLGALPGASGIGRGLDALSNAGVDPGALIPHKLDWVIVGGESGVGARAMSAVWVRSLRDQCASAGVPFFFKQWGNWIDADEWFDRIEASGAFVTVRGTTFHPPRPLNFEHAAQLAADDPHEHHSDGTTSIMVGKRVAGRLLDGVEHNGMPQ